MDEGRSDTSSQRGALGERAAAVDLYWLPLGAGGHSVALSGRVFERLAARLNRRASGRLYHSALRVQLAGGSCFVIEQTPVPDSHGAERGVVAGGAVGTRWAGRARIFRYEVRRWPDGVISDAAEAVESPRRLTDDPRLARLIWHLAPDLPTPVWGRDELAAGEMWNSNAVISWLITRSGLDIGSIRPPAGGRAPGWNAGIVVARRAMHDEALRDGPAILVRARRTRARRSVPAPARPAARPPQPAPRLD
jgi:hypothetical protein